MQRLLAAVVLVVALAATPAAAQAQQWAEPAAPLNLTEGAGLPFDGTRNARNVGGPVIEPVGGKLHAAWTEWDGINLEVRVARLDGNRWTYLGQACSPINVDSSRNAFGVSLADDDGAPIVAWSEIDDNGVWQIQASRFDAASGEWRRPWGAVTNEAPYAPEQPDPFYGNLINRSFGADIEVVDGRPYIASRIIRLIPYVNQVHRLRADESSFEKIAAPPSSDSFSLEIETDGEELYAATSDTTESYLTRFTGESWAPVARPVPSSSEWSIGQLAVHEGDPFVLYRAGDATRLGRFTGGSWQQVADVTVPGVVAALAVVDDTPHIATIDGRAISVYAQQGSGFGQVGARVNPTDSTHPDDPDPSDASLVGFDGTPWVGWSGFDGVLWQARVAGFLTGSVPAAAPGEAAPDCAVAQPTPPAGGEEDNSGTTPPPAEGAPGAAPSTAPSVTAPSRSLVGRVRLLSTRVKIRSGGRRVRLAIECKGPGGCRGLVVPRAVNRIRGLELGRVRVNLAAGEARTITLRLKPTARRLLRRGGIVYRLRFVPAA